MAGEVVVDALPYFDQGYDETGVREADQPKQIKKRRLYSPTALANAYELVKKDGISVRKAAVLCNVPQSTLRDRTLGNISVNVNTQALGSAPLFSHDEEKKMFEHFKRMAENGHRCTQKEYAQFAFDYAVQLGKRKKDNPLSLKWTRGFCQRWPELKNISPRALNDAQAKMASKDAISKFFENLQETLVKHELTDKPHLIFSIDEKGVTVNHKSPEIVEWQTVTIIGCGSAAGQAIPPFYVFPGKRMKPDLLIGAAPGSNGTVSETGLSNGSVFCNYLEKHFLKFTPGSTDQKKLILLDDHESHVSVGITEWALEHNIVLSVLPKNCSHFLQPLDIGCFKHFQKIYDSLSLQLMCQKSAVITRYNVCEVASKSYLKSVSPENLVNSFARAGIYPFNADAVPSKHLAEVLLHSESETSESQETIDVNSIAMLKQKERTLTIKIKTPSKERNTISEIVADKEKSEEVMQQITEPTDDKNRNTLYIYINHSNKATSTEDLSTSPQPGPSNMETFSESSQDENEEDVCCQCKQFSPEAKRYSASKNIVKWAQCDICTCKHWVHLSFCTQIKVIRRGAAFLCPCCS